MLIDTNELEKICRKTTDFVSKFIKDLFSWYSNTLLFCDYNMGIGLLKNTMK